MGHPGSIRTAACPCHGQTIHSSRSRIWRWTGNGRSFTLCTVCGRKPDNMVVRSSGCSATMTSRTSYKPSHALHNTSHDQCDSMDPTRYSAERSTWVQDYIIRMQAVVMCMVDGVLICHGGLTHDFVDYFGTDVAMRTVNTLYRRAICRRAAGPVPEPARDGSDLVSTPGSRHHMVA